MTRRNVIVGAAAGIASAGVFLPGGPAAATRVGCRAPQWAITQWINGNPGNVDTLSGKVVVIDFFQLWCPGCNSFSGPLISEWQQTFADEISDGRLVLVKIHTVFEGRSVQTVERLKTYIVEKDITLPVGVDAHVEGQRLPVTMKRYATRGTPEMAVIDRDGIIRFQKFGFFEPVPVEAMIRDLMGRRRA
ncbi:MAG: TlpA disulfide reductase family protein [Pseudomonadota bacterium]